MAKTTTEETNDVLDSRDLLARLLKENKAHHYQHLNTADYKVSTGSLKLDRKMGGGFGPGVHRLVGYTEGGKTSAAFAVMLNFMKGRKKRKVFYVKAEGRLGPEIQKRSGLKFVFKAEDWVDGTVFVFKCNVFETVASVIRSLIQNNEEGYEYGFILDSMDSLNRIEDMEKSFTEADRVAGGPLMTSVFMKKLNLPLCEAGHITFLISQVRSEVKIDPYAKTANKGGMFSGGNAALHYPNWILEFQPRWAKDYIYENPDAKEVDKRGATLGKLVKVKIDKSTNETTGDILDYPIKHGRENGTSIWVEREIVEELIVRAIVYPKGAWLYWAEVVLKPLQDHFGEAIPLNFNGKQRLYDYVENNPEVRDFLYNYLVTL